MPVVNQPELLETGCTTKQVSSCVFFRPIGRTFRARSLFRPGIARQGQPQRDPGNGVTHVYPRVAVLGYPADPEPIGDQFRGPIER